MGGDMYRQATREELDLAVQWATAEGWNPGKHDADIFWTTDPEGYVCIERDGEVIGTGSIVSYGSFGFMGFFIVRPDLRGQGIGAPFWQWRKQRLLDRMGPGSGIGMDGVFDMQHFYANGGFQFTHRNIRMQGHGLPTPMAAELAPLSDIPFEAIQRYDTECFGFNRERFLRSWIAPIDGWSLGHRQSGTLSGFGVIRPCETGFKIGPLFADSADIAEKLFRGLAGKVGNAPVFLDTPENNQAALALADKYGMHEVFGCARMYCGPVPDIPWRKVFGVTTFELG